MNKEKVLLLILDGVGTNKEYPGRLPAMILFPTHFEFHMIPNLFAIKLPLVIAVQILKVLLCSL